jgi:hypothetical protein
MFYLVADLVLIFLGLLILAALVAMAMLALNTLRIALQMVEQGRPVVAQGKRLAIKAQEISGTVQRASREIRGEVNSVKEEVGHRASQTGLLLRYAIFSPVISVLASAAGVRRGTQSWRTARRARMQPIQPESERTITHPELSPEVEERHYAA